ncbi:chemotaxis protein CheB [Roseivirga sp. BDSF3-8]|uniref:chemotaxis protein CheB n=1 Tax=Roseivirga sp. BDSF3-8 TaxID=3241598 RepID=UPI003531B07B
MSTEQIQERNRATENHKIIVVGASMGGLNAFKGLLKQVDASWPVSLFFVQHIHPDHKSILQELMSKFTKLKVVQVTDKAVIRPHCLYLPVPDKHLFIYDGHVYSVSAPKENSARPSVNILFRSAAVAYRERTIGILLSGLLTDGTLGMKAIQDCGGLTMAQHPEEAEFPEMPLNAIKEGYASHSQEIASINKVLKKLIFEPVDILGNRKIPEILVRQVEAVANFSSQVNEPQEEPAITLESPDTVEYSLLNVITLMQERTNMLYNLAEKEKMTGRQQMAKHYLSKAKESSFHTENLRRHVEAMTSTKKTA